MLDDWTVIDSYTRAQAIEDGVLIEEPIEKLRQEYGIKFPSVMTSALYDQLNPTDKEKSMGQSLDGRVWDLLTMFRHSAKNFKDSNEMVYKMAVALDGSEEAVDYEIKVIVGPGDTPEPVLTFMLPDED